MKTKLIFIVHPLAIEQAESTNKVILKGIKKKLDNEGLWVEQLHEVLWSYHTAPHLTTKETPFTLVYGADAMFLVEMDMPFWWSSQLSGKENGVGLRCSSDLVNETRDISRIREFAAKQREDRRDNYKVVRRKMQEGDLVLWQVVVPAQQGKLKSNWEEPYRLYQKLPYGVYKLG